MDTSPSQHDEGSERPASDLLVGYDDVRVFLLGLGMPETTNPYYLKRSGWPIGNTAGDDGGKIIASKRRLLRHIEKLTAPQKTDAA